MIIKPKLFHLISDVGTRDFFTKEQMKDLISLLKLQGYELSKKDDFDEWRSCMNIVDKLERVVNTPKEYED